MATGDPVGDRQDLPDEPGERRRVDEPAVHLEPLAIGDEVRLGRLGDPLAGLPERAGGDRQDAALAVRPGHERAAQAELRVAELAKERPGPSQPEPDPEAATILEGPQRLLVREGARRHSFVSSSS